MHNGIIMFTYIANKILDDPILYITIVIGGIVAVYTMIVTAAKVTLEFIVALSDFKKRFKGKDK